MKPKKKARIPKEIVIPDLEVRGTGVWARLVVTDDGFVIGVDAKTAWVHPKQAKKLAEWILRVVDFIEK